MKIAQVAPVGERVPPKKYGGTERVVSALTEELVKRGHEVTLFASGDALTSANLVPSTPYSLREMNIQNPYGADYLTLLNIGAAYSKQEEFDIIHDHNAYLSLPTAMLATTPTVFTIHGSVTTEVRRLYEGLNNLSNPSFVTISKSQAVPMPNLNYVGTVYHGLDMEYYPFSEENDGYLLFVGRISMEKGVHHAIEVAEYLNMPLIIAAKLDPEEKSYFKHYVEPRLNEKIRWVGEVDQEERNRLMSRAYCFLHPVTWREPFGLTLIEAMACGCPVVAFNRGSIPEIIKERKTGFVVEDAPEMIEAVRHIGEIDRSYCRSYSLENFNVKRMTDDYEAIYKKVLDKKNSDLSIKKEAREQDISHILRKSYKSARVN